MHPNAINNPGMAADRWTNYRELPSTKVEGFQKTRMPSFDAQGTAFVVWVSPPTKISCFICLARIFWICLTLALPKKSSFF